MRTMVSWTTASCFALLLASSCGPTPEQQATPDTPPESVPQAAPEQSAPALVPAEELEALKTRLQTVKTALFEDGEYNCCVEPSCDWCALHEGSCGCFTNVQAGDAICPGCGLGWHNGQGIVDGVDAGAVKWEIVHSHDTGGHAH